MAKIDLISREWCDMVFEGRNKEYGAYRLRAAAGKRNMRSILLLALGIAAVAVILIVNNVVQNALKSGREANETITAISQLKKEEKKEEKKQEKLEYEKPVEEKVAVKASIQFTVPKIVNDNEVVADKKLKAQDEVTKSSFAVASQDYAGDSKNGINIDDLKDNQSAGGTTVPPKEEEIYENIVEQPAQFPGGESALLSYIAKNTKYPSIAQEQGLEGTVNLRFVVEKDGRVGNVTVLKSLSKECDREAVRVIKSLPRFTPARQQGHPVRVYYTIPVRYLLQ